jgi:hypothetical protein
MPLETYRVTYQSGYRREVRASSHRQAAADAISLAQAYGESLPAVGTAFRVDVLNLENQEGIGLTIELREKGLPRTLTDYSVRVKRIDEDDRCTLFDERILADGHADAINAAIRQLPREYILGAESSLNFDNPVTFDVTVDHFNYDVRLADVSVCGVCHGLGRVSGMLKDIRGTQSNEDRDDDPSVPDTVRAESRSVMSSMWRIRIMKCEKCGNEDPKKWSWCEMVPHFHKVLGVEGKTALIELTAHAGSPDMNDDRWYCDCGASVRAVDAPEVMLHFRSSNEVNGEL